MTQNFKLNTKITYVFLKLCFVLFTLEGLVIHENAVTFFFPKIILLPYHPHLHQIFTTLPLTSIPQQP